MLFFVGCRLCGDPPLPPVGRPARVAQAGNAKTEPVLVPCAVRPGRGPNGVGSCGAAWGGICKNGVLAWRIRNFPLPE